jgi:8-oxo-dGTP diphosphatase
VQKCDPVQHVAVGVLRNDRGEVLVARRHPRAHQGGLWEFPGGKVLPGEDVVAALRRELKEEVGVDLATARPLIRIHHAYADRHVLLDVWYSRAFAGTAWGREGQAVRWVAPEDLLPTDFPAANGPIIKAAQLPSLYAISDEPRTGVDALLSQMERVLAAGVRLIQLRAKSWDEPTYRAAAHHAASLCRNHHAKLLLNAPPHWVEPAGAAGVHLPSRHLMALNERPLGSRYWVAASCHTVEEVIHACRLGVDFLIAGPVQATASHPGTPMLGWEGLRTLTEVATVPVYALGGLGPADRDLAYRYGAQGVGAISSLWKSPLSTLGED